MGREWAMGLGPISKVGQRLDISSICVSFLPNICSSQDTVINRDFLGHEVLGQIMDKDWTLGCPMFVQL